MAQALGVAVLGLLFIAVGLVDAWGFPGGVVVDPWWFAIPLAVACGAMLIKRRHPLVALGIGLVAFGVDAYAGGSLGVIVALVDLLYAAALFSGPGIPRRLVAAALAVVLAVTAVTFIVGGSLQDTVIMGVQAFALLGTPLWWGLSVRQQRELADLAAARALDIQRLSELRESDAVRGERTRMASELHDALAGNLSAIAIHSAAALAQQQPDHRDAEALRAIRSASIEALEELRSMIELLRGEGDALIAPARLAEVCDLVTAVRSRGVDVHYTVTPDPPPHLPAAVDHAAYRIVQEALANATRHAIGAAVHVSVEVAVESLSIVVSNSRGASMVDPTLGGLGTTTMRERSEALGGSFAAGWDSNDDWVVRATIPIVSATV
ncbi:sensor histidine kinase [Salinibacterium hongtaonis]|uniref:sensor histidine kinase n=1 Tax=Homoserinimonas hongtaonis TaxID=2079791 RepID=UPI0013049380|nr:histidine kinase [Salinibacterium hongtaonis]